MIEIDAMLIVSGPPCAGKTSLGQYLAERHGFTHIEASDHMRELFSQYAGQGVAINEFARTSLLNDPAAVPRHIIDHIKTEQMRVNSRLVVTGFRALAEVDYARQHIKTRCNASVVYIDACLELRFQRCAARRRDSHTNGRRGFMREENVQLEMGLDKFKFVKDLIVIENNGTYADYLGSTQNFLDSLLW